MVSSARRPPGSCRHPRRRIGGMDLGYDETKFTEMVLYVVGTMLDDRAGEATPTSPRLAREAAERSGFVA